jgi:DNA-binding response OmpR family regulator
MSRVLIVEDEAHLAQGLRFNLEAEGHSVEVAGDGERAIELLLGHQENGRKENGRKENGKKENNKRGGGKREASKREASKREEFDAVVLDVMLPGKDGFAVATELRAAKNFVPVLMLTARGRPEDVLKGFASGADDYLPKPFELPILLARLQGLLRRRQWMGVSQAPAPDAFSFDGRTIDFGKLELRVNRNVIQLTLMETELLRHLVRNSGRIVSRKAILEEVWGLREDTDTRAIDNFIVRLRRYIEDDPAKPKHLLTVRGVGYRFVPEPGES